MQGNIMRAALVPGLLVLAILVLTIIMAVPGLEAQLGIALADLLIDLGLPVMTDHEGHFLGFL